MTYSEKLLESTEYLQQILEERSEIDPLALKEEWSEIGLEDNFYLSAMEMLYRDGAYGIARKGDLKINPDYEGLDTSIPEASESITVEHEHALDEDQIREFSKHFRRHLGEDPDRLDVNKGRIKGRNSLEAGEREKVYELMRYGEDSRKAVIGIEAPVVELSPEVEFLLEDVIQDLRQQYHGKLSTEERRRFDTLKERA